MFLRVATAPRRQGLDRETAFRWWERALELQPRLVEVRAQYAATYGLVFLRRDDARRLAEITRAVADDPRNAFCNFLLSLCLLALGRTADGVAQAERAYDLDPLSFLTIYGRLAIALSDRKVLHPNLGAALVRQRPRALLHARLGQLPVHRPSP